MTAVLVGKAAKKCLAWHRAWKIRFERLICVSVAEATLEELLTTIL